MAGMLGGLNFALQAEIPKSLSPGDRQYYDQVEAYNKFSPDERSRYEHGVALDKTIALYGLATLSHYNATVVSIKPAVGGGGGGAEIELHTQTALHNESNCSWSYTVPQPIAPRILHWHWPDARPVPACVSLEVEAYADSKDRVRRIFFNVAPGVIAMRRMTPNGPWEVLIAAHAGARGENKAYLLLQPDHFNLGGFEIEWNAEYGLALSLFQTKYGGGGINENEGDSKNWPGWSVTNLPGSHVRPGRDGWELSKEPTTAIARRNIDKATLRLVPARQYIATSDGWDAGQFAPN